MAMQLLLLWLITPLLLWVAAAESQAPNCSARCGNIVVPYPFGIGDPSCSRDSRYDLTCNSNQLLYRNFTVRKISLTETTMTIEIPMAFDCYNASCNDGSINFTDAPFTLSVKKNRFTAIGCNTIATLEGPKGKYNTSSCMSLCDHNVNVTEQGSCSGVGCCQATIPKGIKTFKMLFATPNNPSSTKDFNPCSYAFLADHELLNFSQIVLSKKPQEMPKTPVVLDWYIESKPGGSGNSGECGQNAECLNSTSGAGYICKCLKGYQPGNPFHSDGCQDINECEEPKKYPCGGICKNTRGNYTCKCPRGKTGYGNKNETCEGFDWLQLAALIGSPALLTSLVISTQYAFEKTMAAKNVLENGGLFSPEENVETFSTQNLRMATKNYDSGRLLGQGSTGEVYKGSLSDNTEVVIKKSEEMDENQLNQFRKEVSIVSKVIHKNVVKLLGLCLETKVPQLVYEFISNKTLFQHIHENGGSKWISSWKNRLRIATQIAQVLDHFHSNYEPPIIHGNIKSKNIFIYGGHTAKVSDFGASALFPSGKRGVAKRVLSNMGYLDPEYLQTSDLTPKADVYSFGVVLVELLTGEPPFPDERSKERRNIIQNFISHVERNCQIQFWKVRDANPDEVEQMRAVATLAVRCLKGNGGERPTMKEVANELYQLQGTQQDLDEESESLVREQDFHSNEVGDPINIRAALPRKGRKRNLIITCFKLFCDNFNFLTDA